MSSIFSPIETLVKCKAHCVVTVALLVFSLVISSCDCLSGGDTNIDVQMYVDVPMLRYSKAHHRGRALVLISTNHWVITGASEVCLACSFVSL